MIKKTLLSFIQIIFIACLSAQPIPTVLKDTNMVEDDMDVFAKAEIQKMDSMLNIWYVKNELTTKHSVLSKLKDDSYAYDNNDSLIYKRLSQIVTAVPMAYNERVKRFIELYSVQRQRSSSAILALAQYYYPWMKAIFDKYNVPEELVYITIIESALNPLAVSRAGATGIWQFMYNTGKLYGLEVNTFVDDRRDPYKATEAAARHFRDLYNIFNDWGLAISAYNCGAGNVRKAIQRSGGKTDFWGVAPYLPKETQNYFPAFIGAYYMMTYHNLYGIAPSTLRIPTNVDTVMVDKEIHLQQVSEVLGIDMDEIHILNPQYKRDIIPAYHEKYPLRLQTQDILRFIALKDSIQRYRYDDFFNPTRDLTTTTETGDVIVQTTPNKYHTVRKGETLSKIASKYGTTVNKLKALNHLRSSSLRIGQRLLVRKGTTITKPAPKPASGDSTLVARDSTMVSADSSVVVKDTIPATTKPATNTTNNSTGSPIIYIVKKGDTLSSIGRKYGVTATAIAKYNNLRNENAIQAGQKLKIPR
ncbi:MAG: LysM peptidoglycan-binding domain-containing protein [Bacteroidales bacterium]|nr:LysM peptidoglycan-binding domain-containing protein [Bacteroidales bacterium]